jgi:hypothetical protein
LTLSGEWLDPIPALGECRLIEDLGMHGLGIGWLESLHTSRTIHGNSTSAANVSLLISCTDLNDRLTKAWLAGMGTLFAVTNDRCLAG